MRRITIQVSGKKFVQGKRTVKLKELNNIISKGAWKKDPK